MIKRLGRGAVTTALFIWFLVFASHAEREKKGITIAILPRNLLGWQRKPRVWPGKLLHKGAYSRH